MGRLGAFLAVLAAFAPFFLAGCAQEEEALLEDAKTQGALVTIAGSLWVDQTVSAKIKNGDSEGAKYRWYLVNEAEAETPINDAVLETYTIVKADVGCKLGVKVTLKDGTVLNYRTKTLILDIDAEGKPIGDPGAPEDPANPEDPENPSEIPETVKLETFHLNFWKDSMIGAIDYMANNVLNFDAATQTFTNPTLGVYDDFDYAYLKVVTKDAAPRATVEKIECSSGLKSVLDAPRNDQLPPTHTESANRIYIPQLDNWDSPTIITVTVTNGEDSHVFTVTIRRENPRAIATGGEVTYLRFNDSFDEIHTFKNSEELKILRSPKSEMRFLVVAGGGGGGYSRNQNISAGSGGAGGLLEGFFTVSAGEVYPVTVGSGGDPARNDTTGYDYINDRSTYNTDTVGKNGKDSKLGNFVAFGGGGGGSVLHTLGASQGTDGVDRFPGANGGSGGGGTLHSGGGAGSGVQGQGHDGSGLAGGGAGGDGSSGGAGKSSDISGIAKYYAVGGKSGNGLDGEANSGSGGNSAVGRGGSAVFSSGRGGSGVVIVRFKRSEWD